MNPGQDGSGAEFVRNLALAQDLSSQIHGMLRLAHRRARTLDGELASEIAGAADTASNLVYFLSSSLFAAEPRAGESADYLDVLIQRLSDTRLVVAAGCWVVADSGRARRLTTLISAWRGSTAPALTRAQTTRSDGCDRPHSQR